MNRSMPPGVVIPVLIYPDVREAVDWLCSSFGFVERLRIGTHRSQLTLAGGSVVLTERRAEADASRSATGLVALPAEALGCSVMVRVSDVESHYERARRVAARIISPPTDYPYGERQYTAEDLAGYRWTFSQTLADVDPTDWGGTLFD